ncbi:hypothetical protein [Moorena sp. SIO4G3]|nr:hypothetical protein [Moorena sp. SIO4G3]
MGETPKTALPPQDRAASLNLEIVWRWLNNANHDNNKITAR